MKKAIVEISEGLGNQLFMYANAYSFSKKKGYHLFIDSKSAYKKLKIRSFMLENMNIDIKDAKPSEIPDNLFKNINFKIHRKLDYFRKNKRFLVEHKLKDKRTRFKDYTNENYSDKVYIKGYFESEKYFINYKNLYSIRTRYSFLVFPLSTIFTIFSD